MKNLSLGFLSATVSLAAAFGQTDPSNWHPLGPTNMPYFETSMGRVNCVAAVPGAPNKLYLGTPAGGVWSSDDAGVSWTPRSDFLPVLGVSSIVIDPNDPTLIYIATGDADSNDTGSIGVWKSVDGGTNWVSTGLSWPIGDYRLIHKLAMSPSNSMRILAASNDGIYSSSDGGTNWLRVTPGNNKVWYDVKFQPGNASTLYATGAGANFFTSSDGGTNWNAITAGLPPSAEVARSIIAVSAGNSAGVYLLDSSATNNGYYGLYRSLDGGNTFSLRSASTGSFQFGQQGWFDLALAVSPTNFDELYLGSLVIGKSVDGGVSWQGTPYSSTHVDVHDLVFLNGVLYAGTDGGLHVSTNGAATWRDLSATLQIAEIYHVAGAQQNPALIYVGEQDNGLNRLQNSSWEHLMYGDVGQPIVDPIDETTVFAMRQPNSFLKTTNAWAGSTLGQGYTETQITRNERSAWPAPPLVISPMDRRTLYAGLENIWKTTDAGDTWSPISSFSDGNVCQVLAVTPTAPDIIYALRGGAFWRTSDAGAHWVNLSGALLYNAVALAVSSTDPNQVWVGQNDYVSSNKVYASTNGGTNWTAYTGSLPNRDIKCLVYENGSNAGLYAGFDAGVYYRNAAMPDWQSFNNQLPNAPVSDLQVNYPSGKLRAATFGRGLWETSLATVNPVLTCSVSAGSLILSWAAQGALLQQTPDLSAPNWTTIASNSPVKFPTATGGRMFFRLKK